VELGSSLGILTDRDLRSRVVAVGLSPDAPVSEAMTAPADTVPPSGPPARSSSTCSTGLSPLSRALARRGVLGVIGDSDLVEIQTHSSFSLRGRSLAPLISTSWLKPLRPCGR